MRSIGRIILEAIVVGMTTLIVGFVFQIILQTPKTVVHATSWVLFLTGGTIHLLLEFVGANRMWCLNAFS